MRPRPNGLDSHAADRKPPPDLVCSVTKIPSDTLAGYQREFPIQ